MLAQQQCDPRVKRASALSTHLRAGTGRSKDVFLCRSYLLIIDASQPLVL